MKKCKRCGAAVPADPLSLFEHTLLAHSAELLRDPRRLARVAADPQLRTVLGREILRTATRSLTLPRLLKFFAKSITGGKK